MNSLIKTLRTAGIIALGCLLITGMPASAWADQDLDGLTPELEEAGFDLMAGFELWNAVGRVWQPDPDIIPGSVNCPPGAKCLSDSRPDLFVILRLEEPSNIDLQSCDIFALGSRPADQGGLGFNIWVLREAENYFSDFRKFTDFSEQRAVILQESLGTSLSITGWAEYGTIMDEGKGFAIVYTNNILNNIEVAAETDPNVQSDTGALYDQYPYPAGSLQCQHFQNTTIHEILHVLWTLENDLKSVYSHHITKGDYIMNPAIVVTEKKGKVTYYIPEEASRSTRATWSFGSYPR